jgi:GntR family transcriptional regulator
MDTAELSHLARLARQVIRWCRAALNADGRAVEGNEMTLDSAAYVLDYAFDA